MKNMMNKEKGRRKKNNNKKKKGNNKGIPRTTTIISETYEMKNTKNKKLKRRRTHT